MLHRQESGTDLKNKMRDKFYNCEELFNDLSEDERKKYETLMTEARRAFLRYVRGLAHSNTYFLEVRDKLDELHKHLHKHKRCDNPVPADNATETELFSFFNKPKAEQLITQDEENSSELAHTM